MAVQCRRGVYFDDKLAQNPIFKYSSNNRDKWASAVRNFFTGRCACARAFLRWAEDQELKVITLEQLRAEPGLAMLDVDVYELS